MMSMDALHELWTAKQTPILLGTTWHWPTVTLISVLGRRMITMGTTGWRRGTEGR